MPFDRGQAMSARLGRLGAVALAAVLCLAATARADPAAEFPLPKARATLQHLRATMAPPSAMPAEIGPQDAVLLDRLCAEDLRTNEEDRLFGLISLSVRATIRYRGGEFAPDLIDDAAQDSLTALLKDCGRLVVVDPAYRLGDAVEDIERATEARMAAPEHPAADGVRSLEKATAADLSEELTSPEIDAWLDGLAPQERALALFLYASDVTPTEVADAVGVPLDTLNSDVAATKTKLLGFFQERQDATPNVPGAGPAIEYREAGTSAAALLQPDPPAAPPPHDPPAPGQPPSSRPPQRPAGALRITGISSDLYAGWSLLAIAVDLPADKNLEIDAPFILASDATGKRYIVVAAAEISQPTDAIRRFLLKAYAIDGDSGDAGFHDTLHLVADHVDNPAALLTLHNPGLSDIEIARCLWHDYGNAADPGLCR